MNKDLLLLKGAITELPEEEQKEVHAMAEKIREIIKSKPSIGVIALGLVGLESQDE